MKYTKEEYVAVALATLDGIYYWKYDFPENERSFVQHSYEKEARRFIIALEAIKEYEERE